MASAHLQITVQRANNLYNADGILAGKSDPYVIVEVPGQDDLRFQTPVLNNTLNPVWNFTGEIKGFMDGDFLQFTVMDSDTFPKPDQLLGKVALTAQDVYPQGLHAELALGESKTEATLSVTVHVLGNIPAPEEAVAVPGMHGEGTNNLALIQTGRVSAYGHACRANAAAAVGAGKLKVTVMRAAGLYNADWGLAGKSDPYVTCSVQGRENNCKFQTPVMDNTLDPVWNHVAMLKGFVDGEVLEFQVWDKDVFPKPDDFLGKVVLNSSDFFPHGLEGELLLSESKVQDATLTLRIEVFPDTKAAGSSAVSLPVHEPEQGMEAPMAHGAHMNHSYPTNTHETVPSTMTYGGPPPMTGRGPSPMTYGAPSPMTYGAPLPMVGAPSPMTYGAPSPMTCGTPLPPRSEVCSTPLREPVIYSRTVHPAIVVPQEEYAKGHGTIVYTAPEFQKDSCEQGLREVQDVTVEKKKGKSKSKLTMKKRSKRCC